MCAVSKIAAFNCFNKINTIEVNRKMSIKLQFNGHFGFFIKKARGETILFGYFIS